MQATIFCPVFDLFLQNFERGRPIHSHVRYGGGYAISDKRTIFVNSGLNRELLLQQKDLSLQTFPGRHHVTVAVTFAES